MLGTQTLLIHFQKVFKKMHLRVAIRVLILHSIEFKFDKHDRLVNEYTRNVKLITIRRHWQKNIFLMHKNLFKIFVGCESCYVVNFCYEYDDN